MSFHSTRVFVKLTDAGPLRAIIAITYCVRDDYGFPVIPKYIHPPQHAQLTR
jgi:hypothetical protein